MSAPAAAAKPAAPKTALTEKASAARFFASHGLGKVGELLGDSLSGQEASNAARDAASEQKALARLSTPTFSAPKAIAPLERRPRSVTPAPFNFDMDEDDDDGAEDTKKRWAAVDALKRRHHAFA